MNSFTSSLLSIVLVFIVNYNSIAQETSSVVISPVAAIKMENNKSYIYCSSMEMMWNELRLLLNEQPKSCEENELIQKLNHAVPSNYQSPLEEQFVVAGSL